MRFRYLYGTLFLYGTSVLLARALNIPLGLQIPAASVVAFAVSWLIVLGIRKICGKKAKYIVAEFIRTFA